MADLIETTADDLACRTDQGCLYSREGVWVRSDGVVIRLGVTDDTQQRYKDITSTTHIRHAPQF